MKQSDPINLKMAYFRRRAGLTQVALGEKIGRRCSVQQFEEGRTKRLGAADMVKWLEAVEASPEERSSVANQWLDSRRWLASGEAEKTLCLWAGVEGV